MQNYASAIPKAKVVIATTGLVWEQKAHIHSPMRVHVESADVLISEEAQQDMDEIGLCSSGPAATLLQTPPWRSEAKPGWCCGQPARASSSPPEGTHRITGITSVVHAT